MIYTYVFKFKNGEELTFNSEIDVDLHRLIKGYIAFDNILIDLSEVLYLRKLTSSKEA